MTKILLILLLVAMLFSLCGCGGPSDAQGSEQKQFVLETNSFQVGFSRKIMNPTTSVPMAGYSNALNRYSTQIGEDITCTAVAVSDGEGGHVLLITTDLCNSQENTTTMIRQTVSMQTGIEEDHIIITATHTHSAPDLTNTSLEEENQYIALITQQICSAAMEALLDRKDATMYIGSIETENLNFIRHYWVQNKVTGEVTAAGDQFGTFKDADILGHTKQIDPALRLLQFKRTDGNDVILVNWAAHPHFTGGASKYELSSDYVGPFREALEDMTGSNVAFFQGAAGDINETSRISTERRTSDYRTYGALLANYAVDCLNNNMEQAKTGRIQTLHVDFQGQVNHSQNHLYYQALAVSNEWKNSYSSAACKPLMEPYGIRSVYQAMAIVSNYSRTDADCKMSLKAISIGDEFALVSFPGELFSGLFTPTWEQSPYKMTMMLGYAEQHLSYLPTAEAYEYSCYESDITRFAPGTGEQVQQQHLNMLLQLSENY